MTASPPSPAVRPQPAAGIVLLRQASGRTEVLLGRRSASMRFMPGYYVFPGGRLDPFDHKASGFPEPRPENPGADADKITRELMAALRRAALRETWEETGLLIGDRRAEEAPKGRSPAGVWRAYRKAGVAPAFGSLQFIARAITPPTSPIRFHSRFFLCCTEDLELAGTLAGDGELEDLSWQALSVLDELPMANVTHAVLTQALRRHRDPSSRPCLFLYRHGRLSRR